MLVRGRVKPGWADDPVRRQDGRRQRGIQEILRQEGRVRRVNKCCIIFPEWSMSEVGTPPPHNLYKPHVLVYSINNNNIV